MSTKVVLVVGLKLRVRPLFKVKGAKWWGEIEQCKGISLVFYHIPPGGPYICDVAYRRIGAMICDELHHTVNQVCSSTLHGVKPL